MQKLHIFLSVLLFWSLAQEVKAQLGFCSGNSGDPIFTETFGTGTQDGPPLPAGTTTYNYVNGGPQQPVDGNYTISSSTDYFDWFDTVDHTPGDTNGKSFIVNASFTAGEFYRRTIDGLCENTSYEFSSWLINLLPRSGCGGNGIPINVRFEIWDSTDSNLLASGDTGDIFSKATATWEQYALVFQTAPGQTSVILKMLNNGEGGCGNDLAIDDIVFRTCGDNITIANNANSTSIGACGDQTPVTTTLVATPDFSIFQNHFFQWQTSSDNQNWTDIAGENNQSYTTPALNTTTYYRVKAAEDPINLGNTKCNIVSDVFDVIIEAKPDAPISAGDVALCADKPGGVLVSVPNGISVNWYDAPIGGNLLLEDNSYYATMTSGTYHAEAVTGIAHCISDTRTAVTITYFDLPVLEDEQRILCEGESITLSAGLRNATYLWNTGETSPEIEVDTSGTYTVQVTDSNGCAATKMIVLSQIDRPIIDRIDSDHRSLTIFTENEGEFEYSLDGFTYQESPVFENTLGGTYIAYVRNKNNCVGLDSFPFLHVVIPRFFTPNGDGINDSFRPEGTELFETFSIRIFDRSAKLLAQSTGTDFSWDGTFNNSPLPATDYWYNIQIGDTVFKGHFALKR